MDFQVESFQTETGQIAYEDFDANQSFLYKDVDNWPQGGLTDLGWPMQGLEARVAAQRKMIENLQAKLAELSNKENLSTCEWTKWVREITAAVNKLQLKSSMQSTNMLTGGQERVGIRRKKGFLLGIPQKKVA
ncbi:hypothetical protein M433DRAFT_138322 [Acidomyces richmondensis BFW]|nr:hypothetical protein M433DRAFT_138322 [Acidomyces richmondensis BFW]